MCAKKIYKSKKEIREHKKKQQIQEFCANKENWKYKMVFTSKKPNKNIQNLCKQLRMILKPEVLLDNENLHINETKLDRFATEMNLSHYVSVKLVQNCIEMELVDRKTGIAIKYTITEYQNNFKNYSNEIYKEKPFLSTEGLTKEELSFTKELFNTKQTKDFRRVLMFKREGNNLYIRHYLHKVANDTSNFVVKLFEIGPRLTLTQNKQ